MKTSRKLCPRFAEFNTPRSDAPSSALPSAFGGGLALPALGVVPKVAKAPAPVPVPKGSLKLKLGAGVLPPGL